MEDHILDLDKRLWSVNRYGLTAIGTWVRVDGRWRPCMVIVRDAQRPWQPCVIPLEELWHWSDVIGNPLKRAGLMLIQLGIDPHNPENLHRLISLVNSRMADLVSMPPRPPSAEEHASPVAELTTHDEFHGRVEVEI